METRVQHLMTRSVQQGENLLGTDYVYHQQDRLVWLWNWSQMTGGGKGGRAKTNRTR